MKLLNEKEWMVRWALMGEPAEIPIEMLVQTPHKALYRQLKNSRLPNHQGSKTLYNLKGVPLRDVGQGLFRIWLSPAAHYETRDTQKGRPYVISFPPKSKRTPGRQVGHYKHLDNALKRLHQEAKRRRYV